MFQVLPHTADIRLKVSSSNQAELFRDALQGMSEIQRKGFCQNSDLSIAMKEHISISSPDITSLLIDFLSEVLTLCHINKALYCQVSFESLTPNTLIAEVYGLPFDDVEEDIKAVTYHEANIQQLPDGTLETFIVFDI